MAELKYTKHLLGKMEDLFKEVDYTIRYAKGTFQSGYCIVEQQKIAVINKFYETEGRINVLIDILDRLNIEEDSLSEKCLKTYKQVMKHKHAEAEAANPEEQEEKEGENDKEEQNSTVETETETETETEKP